MYVLRLLHHRGGREGFSYDTPMTIAGGDSYAIEWTLGTPSGGLLQQMQPEGVIQSIVRKVKSEMEFVFFSPGDYEATVTLSYHAGDPPDSFRTITQSAVVHVAAPQSVILLGAAVADYSAISSVCSFFPRNRML